ncbi:toprim domain-containing protein [Gemmiger formicilis]|nr:toprim domain-containing protein [Gemmiger formicilis]
MTENHAAHQNWRGVHYLALGGTDYAALDAFLTYYPNITHIVLCLDNDEAGRTRTQDIIKHLEGSGKTVEDRPPTIGKDYNDTLVQVTQEYQKHCISLDDILEETR